MVARHAEEIAPARHTRASSDHERAERGHELDQSK
jgi:hypothetical protein